MANITPTDDEKLKLESSLILAKTRLVAAQETVATLEREIVELERNLQPFVEFDFLSHPVQFKKSSTAQVGGAFYFKKIFIAVFEKFLHKNYPIYKITVYSGLLVK
jgi:hypothetical protein